jgi:hypothetical protein
VKKIMYTMLSFAASLVLLTAAGSKPAYAAFSDCPAGTACVWNDINGGGSMYVLAFSTYYPGCRTLPFIWQDVVSSIRVTYGSGYGVWWFTGNNCTGGNFYQKANTQVNLPGTGFNDTLNTFRICLPSGC